MEYTLAKKFSQIIILIGDILHINYCLAIVLVCFLLRIILFPISARIFIYRRKISMIKAEKETINNKYPESKMRKEREKEIKRLYEKNGIDFKKQGCLPILIQLPIIVLFVNAITNNDIITHTKFLWFTLGERDSLYLLPICAGVMTLLEAPIANKIENVSKGIKRMLIMPCLIVFLGVFFQSSLLVFWITSSLISIIQNIFLLNRERLLVNSTIRDVEIPN
ncbi:membrane protein insertase YidC [Bacillus pacificus]|uniref:membrane protein insertase YidC n=1 Tax=Bacillus TaxID=1386 RepID=UPI001FB41961|nr:membrane protein insertase YidC [Bacillus sp. ZJS3]UOB79041.1 membrane protein insertase YidC [Bacillus sp. ZJS3]